MTVKSMDVFSLRDTVIRDCERFADAAHVMDTFPIVRKSDEKEHGEYRTKRVILELFDAMAEAARTGKPYATRLDPPPADPRVTHPDTRRRDG
jgi:hypothetical protein